MAGFFYTILSGKELETMLDDDLFWIEEEDDVPILQQ
jgi:hypothetical protein